MSKPMRLAALFLVACSGTKDPTDTGSDLPDLDPLAELGSGDITFESLEDGDTIYVIYGPQGGYHFLASVRAQGVVPGNRASLDDPANPTTSFFAYRDGTRIDMNASVYKQGLTTIADEPGVYEMVGRFLILDIQSDRDLDGVEVEIEVEVVDTKGVTIADRRTLIAEPHPLND